jgi:hypothetical protein
MNKLWKNSGNALLKQVSGDSIPGLLAVWVSAFFDTIIYAGAGYCICYMQEAIKPAVENGVIDVDNRLVYSQRLVNSWKETFLN